MWKFLTLLGCLGLLALCAEDSVTKLFTALQSSRALMTLLYCVLLVACFPLLLLNLSVSMVLSPFEAFAVTLAGSLLGTAVSFVIAKHCLKDSCRQVLENYRLSRKLLLLVEKEPFKYQVLVRFMDGPMFVKNYGLASLQVDFKSYFASAFLHFGVLNALQVCIGNLRELSMGTVLSLGVPLGCLATLSYLTHSNIN